MALCVDGVTWTRVGSPTRVLVLGCQASPVPLMVRWAQAQLMIWRGERDSAPGIVLVVESEPGVSLIWGCSSLRTIRHC